MNPLTGQARHSKNNPPLIILCSCRETVVVIWDAEAGRYVAQEMGWKFRMVTMTNGVTRGWYCGQEDHYQLEYVSLPESVTLKNR